MSSAVYINYSKPILLEEWQEFAKKEGIVYSPKTVGRNIFYFGEVEINFGEPNFISSPKLSKKIIISTYWMGDLNSVDKVVRKILKKWPKPIKFKYDDEFNYAFKQMKM